MLDKSLVTGVILNGALPFSDNVPPQPEIIQLIGDYFKEEISNVIKTEIAYIARDVISLESLVGNSCSLVDKSESSTESYNINSASYFCDSEYLGEFKFNVAEIISGDFEMKNGKICRDLKIFVSQEKGIYNYGESAHIASLNGEGNYTQEYFYPNSNCDDVMNNGISFNK